MSVNDSDERNASGQIAHSGADQAGTAAQPVKAKGHMSVCGIVGLVFAVVGLALSFIPIINNIAAVFGLVGVVLGIIGLVGVMRGKRTGRAVAIIAIAISVASIVITLAMQAAASKAIDDAFSQKAPQSTQQTEPGGDHSKTTEKNSDNDADESPEAKGDQDKEGDLRDMHVTIVSAVKSGNDYNGKPTVMVTYEWVNQTEKNGSFMALADAKVFQNGRSLELAMYIDNPQGYDASSSMTALQPKAKGTVTEGYVLQDDSPITVEVTDLFSLDDSAKVKHTFDLK